MKSLFKSRIALLTIVFLLLQVSCTEVFDPSIEHREGVLVVEGLLTDQWGPHWVKLSEAVPYDGRFQERPVSNARVFLTNQNGEKYPFNESQQAGLYQSAAGLMAREGYTYVLHIETEQGEFYESKPQMLNLGQHVDELESRFSRLVVEQQNAQGETYYQEIPGLEFTAELETENGSSPMIRFEAIMLVQYVLFELGKDNPDLMYCRRKFPLGDEVNVVVPDFDSSLGDVVRHQVTFMPQTLIFSIDNPGWGLLRIDRRILILRQYALNPDAYIFYKGLREQLASEGRIFDPIPGQLTGNIKCTSSPGKPALGLFEVSARFAATFALMPEPINENRTGIWRINNLDYLPELDCSYELIPYDWLY